MMVMKLEGIDCSRNRYRRMLKRVSAVMALLMLAGAFCIPVSAEPQIIKETSLISSAENEENDISSSNDLKSSSKESSDVVAEESVEMAKVMVELSPQTDIESVKNVFYEISEGVVTFKYTYKLLINGFSAEVPVNLIEKLSEVNGVEKISLQASFELMSMAHDEIDGIVKNAETAETAENKNSSETEPETAEEVQTDDSKVSSEIQSAPGKEVVYTTENGSGGAFSNVNSGKYQGDGILVAVIDSGFKVDHSDFAVPENAKISEALPKGKVESIGSNFCAAYKSGGDGLYVSSKIPFAYDYADGDKDVYSNDKHGTFVAGIIGADTTKEASASASGSAELYNGIVPNAQMMFMKVCSDSASYAYTGDILAALEDAFAAGADVVNMSFGSMVNRQEYGLEFFSLEEPLTLLAESGIAVVCPVGNYGRGGDNSYYSNNFGISAPTVSEADTGILSVLAQIDSVISVASKANDYFLYDCIRLEDENGTAILFTDTVAAYIPDYDKGFTGFFDGKKPEYVLIEGFGKEENYSTINDGELDGRIVVVSRGEISFKDKVNIAASHGAAGVIVYDNAESEELVNMDLTDAVIPAVFISMKSGKLLSDAKNKTLDIVYGDKCKIENPDKNTISEFSSSGPTYDLRIKPDITAVGENLVSSSYTSFAEKALSDSGTSVSSASVAAAMAVLKQYSEKNGYQTGSVYLKSLLMNAAKPIVSDKTGAEYSPRVQGSGLLDIDAAQKLKGILTNSDGESKVELGEINTVRIKMSIKLTNITSSEQTYKISTTMLKDEYKTYTADELPLVNELNTELPYFTTGNSVKMCDAIMKLGNRGSNINRYSFDKHQSENYGIVTVAAGETKSIDIIAIIDQKTIKEYSEVFGNGFFIEGYIYAEASNGIVSSIPYMGFYGEWTDLPVFDSTVYDSNSVNRNTYLFTKTKIGILSFSVELGRNITDDSINYNYSKLAFSPNFDGYGDILFLSLDLKRNVSNLNYKITDSNGRVLTSLNIGGYSRNYSVSKTLFNYKEQIWDGIDLANSQYVYQDGLYYLTVYATPMAPDAKTQKFTVPFKIDNTPAEFVGYEISVNEDGKKEVSVTVSDSGGIQSVDLYQPKTIKHDEWLKSNTLNQASDELSEPQKVTFVLPDSLTESKYVYIDVMDYGYNTSTFRLKLN